MSRFKFLLFGGIILGGCAMNDDTDIAPSQAVTTTRATTMPTTNPISSSTTRPSKLTADQANALVVAEKAVFSNPQTSDWGHAQSVNPSRNGGFIVNFGFDYVGPRNVWVHDSQVEIQPVR
jgi:hypothetical protein